MAVDDQPSPVRAYKRPESVLIVVHSRAGDILLLKRADIADFWQSVTGSLRRRESTRGAALRELQEETGLTGADRLLDWRRSARFEILDRFKPRYAPGTRYNVEHMFSLEIDSGRPVRINPREHERYLWVPYRRALEMVWSWSNRDAIRAVGRRCSGTPSDPAAPGGPGW